MRIIETRANITGDHLLSIQLPEDIEAGQYQIAIIINSQPEPKPKPLHHQLNQLAGKIKAFNNIDPVAWQQQIRDEWDSPTTS
jgi:predicted ribonuclease toxin of YeeF-YezG toxin-antitoxin module